MSERVNPSYLKVVAKAFRVIETLSQVKAGMPLSELARRVKQLRATVFRIVFTLKQLGYVEQDPRREAYGLPPQIGWQTRKDVLGTLKATARPCHCGREFDSIRFARRFQPRGSINFRNSKEGDGQ
jgi:hypothetical protein